MNIRSLLAKLKPSCSAPTKEEKEKAPKQVIRETKSEFSED